MFRQQWQSSLRWEWVLKKQSANLFSEALSLDISSKWCFVFLMFCFEQSEHSLLVIVWSFDFSYLLLMHESSFALLRSHQSDFNDLWSCQLSSALLMCELVSWDSSCCMSESSDWSNCEASEEIQTCTDFRFRFSAWLELYIDF